MTQISSHRTADLHHYEALRQTGTSPARARVLLGLRDADAGRLERVFHKRAARGAGDRQLPKFARHEAHVAACMAHGGFWAFSERRVGPGLYAVCLPMIAPGA